MSAEQELTALIRGGLVAAYAIGDYPGHLDHYAESVLSALSSIDRDDEGWILRKGKVFKITDVRDTWEDDGHRTWELVTEEES